MGSAGSARVVNFLKSRGVRCEVVRYEHEEKGALFAARALGVPLHQTVKTLVVDLGDKRYAMVLMPGDRHLDLNYLAAAFAVRRIAMADAATAERVTGYQLGGISRFGARRPLPVVMEARLLGCDKVAINGGERGTMLIMTPGDIVATLGCKVLRIARD